MRPCLLLFGLCICLCSCNSAPGQKRIVKSSSSVTAIIDFKTQVQPIFKTNCSPCHFPGGKLYEKLPFDKAETILHHQAGILKRIKKEEEVKLIKQFAEQNKVVALK
jgi:hypothetical protein